MRSENPSLGEFIIENQDSFEYSTGELSKLLHAIRRAAKVVNHKVRKTGLSNILGASQDTNVQGEQQHKLDVYANEIFIDTLVNREILCGIASEENDDYITIKGQQEDHK